MATNKNELNKNSEKPRDFVVSLKEAMKWSSLKKT